MKTQKIINEVQRRMIVNMGYWTRVLKNITILIISLVAIFLIFRCAIFYMPFLIGFIISLIIEPLVRGLLKSSNLNRKTSAIIIVLVIFAILIGLVTWGVLSLISESSNLLQSLNIYIEKIYKLIEYCSSNFQFERIPPQVLSILENSTGNFISTFSEYVSRVLTGFVQGITVVPIIAIYVVITMLSTYFICTDKFYILDQLEHHLPRQWIKKIQIYYRKIVVSLGNYLKAEVILIGISFLIVLIGLYIFKIVGFRIQYPFLAALVIGFVDALPIVGSGTVMVPWAVISGINGDIKLGISLLALYGITLIARQLIEPRIVSNKIGIHPIFTLIAMYTGFKITGIVGLFIGPIVLIILKNVFGTMIDNGIVKTILNK